MRICIERRAVRRVWIKVHPNGQVVVVASPRYTVRTLQQIIERHREWIERQRARYRGMERICLAPGQMLYRGRAYRFVLRPRLGASVLVYPHRCIIASGANLLAPSVQRQWYMWEAERLVRRRARQLARRYGFTFTHIEIRDYTSAWGYCSQEGVITFDWRIAKVPPSVMDYLILHELVHTKIPNHGPRFWRKLEALYPAYREAVAWLNSYGRWL
ncbi:MAG: M48 family peptidase [Chlorobiota bacterium]|nr:MAG: M48 family peptidase [Chlorobiota bacterium]